MNKSIINRLKVLEAVAVFDAGTCTVVMPDGTHEKKKAAEWWDNRDKWHLASWEEQDNRCGLAVCLMLADIADRAIKEAQEHDNQEEADRLSAERDNMLDMFRKSGRNGT